jgi:hypothetical protein
MKEKILLCSGNVTGVKTVQDPLGVVEVAVEPVVYTAKVVIRYQKLQKSNMAMQI